MTGDPAGNGPLGDDPIKADAALMRRVAAADAAACRGLIDRELPGLLAFTYRLLGNRAEAEDVAQDSFLRLWQIAARWKPKAKIRTWLRRVAYNAAIDRLRRRRPQVDPDDVAIADPARNPAEAAHADQVEVAVAAALAELPERQRAAIALAHYDGLGNQETADILEISVEAVESLLARGRRALRTRLEPLYRELGEPLS